MRHVPDWFPGAGFKQFAKLARELSDAAVNGPLDHVKESLKVGLSIHDTYTLFLGLKNSKVNGANASIAASCFDRVEELADQGFDESVIRSMTASTYIGETTRRRYTLECSLMTLQQPRLIP